MTKTLFFSNQGLSPLLLGIELEIVSKEIAENNSISILCCNNQLNTCFFNPCHNLLACSICHSRTSRFLDIVGVQREQTQSLQQLIKEYKLPQIEKMDDIYLLEYEGINIGRGIVSSLISTWRDYSLTHKDFALAYVEQMAITCANVIENMRRKIEQEKPDRVFLFNGRFAELSCIIELCRSLNLDYYTYEVGASAQKYHIFKNALPHSITFKEVEMDKMWEKEDPKIREKTAIDWFHNRQRGTSADVARFLKKQELGLLPEGFDSNKNNVVIFITSEDEMVAIKEWKFDQYVYQNDALFKIFDRYKSRSDTHFYLRVHPHLRNIESRQVDEIRSMNFPNLMVIHAHEKIDSYALMKNCSKTLTFGSTTGVEAAFLNRPSLLFGRSLYEKIDATYNALNYEELYKLIDDLELKPKPKENTYRYGYYWSEFGQPFKQFINNGKNHSTFRNKLVKRVYPSTLILFLKYLPGLGHWKKMTNIVFKGQSKFKDWFRLNSHVLSEKLK
jgi:hypothetical protein